MIDPQQPLDAGRTALVTDSSCDVPAARRPPNWRVVPIPVLFGAETFEDGVDLDAPGFYARLAAAERLPTTAQPSSGRLEGVLREALEDYETAVVLPLSGRLSGTAEAARAAAEVVGRDRVTVCESGSVSVGLGLLALRLQALLERGCTAGEAAAAVDRLRRSHRAVFSVETLEYLLRGGRIGRAQAAAGSLLRVHPILQLVEGEVAPAGRVRGAHRVLPALEDYLAENTDGDRPLRVAYAHAQRPEAVRELEARVARRRPRAVTELVGEIGPTVGTHAGPGAVALTFVDDALDEPA